VPFALGRIVFRLPHSAQVRIDLGPGAGFGLGAASADPALDAPVGSAVPVRASFVSVVPVVGASVVSVMARASSHDRLC
jgi:hypothetical protein